MNEQSSYRKPEAHTSERVTPHQVATIASKLRPTDAKVLYTLKNQMIDDIRMRVELRRLIENDAPKAELLGVIDTAMGVAK